MRPLLVVLALLAPGLAAASHYDPVDRLVVALVGVETGVDEKNATVRVNGTFDFITGQGNLTVRPVYPNASAPRTHLWTFADARRYYPGNTLYHVEPHPYALVFRGPSLSLDGVWTSAPAPGTFGLSYAERAGHAALDGRLGGHGVVLTGAVVREVN